MFLKKYVVKFCFKARFILCYNISSNRETTNNNQERLRIFCNSHISELNPGRVLTIKELKLELEFKKLVNSS